MKRVAFGEPNQPFLRSHPKQPTLSAACSTFLGVLHQSRYLPELRRLPLCREPDSILPFGAPTVYAFRGRKMNGFPVWTRFVNAVERNCTGEGR